MTCVSGATGHPALDERLVLTIAAETERATHTGNGGITLWLTFSNRSDAAVCMVTNGIRYREQVNFLIQGEADRRGVSLPDGNSDEVWRESGRTSPMICYFRYPKPQIGRLPPGGSLRVPIRTFERSKMGLIGFLSCCSRDHRPLKRGVYRATVIY